MQAFRVRDNIAMRELFIGLIVGTALFALAYNFGALDSFIATWTPISHSGAGGQLDWN